MEGSEPGFGDSERIFSAGLPGCGSGPRGRPDQPAVAPDGEVLPVRHFAKLALEVTFVGWFGSGLGPIYRSSALNLWGVGSFFWVEDGEAVIRGL